MFQVIKRLFIIVNVYKLKSFRVMSSCDKENKNLHIVVGFFFFVNYCIGTGFLGIPYGFVYSGYLAALPTLTFITIATWIGSNYVLEVMARAQVM